jgi:ketosteroid isomerase-like protein
MIILRTIVCFVLLLTALVPSTTAAGDQTSRKAQKVDQEINAANAAWDRAYISGNLEALKKIMADDYLAVWGDGVVKTRDQEFADIKSGAYKMLSVKYHEPLKVHSFGDTAVAVALITPEELFEGKPADNPPGAKFRLMTTWVKKGGQWRVVAMAATLVTPPK